MKLNNQEFKVMPNGDVEAIQIYKEKPVIQAVNGEDIVLGIQPEYKIINVIHKDKIKYLITFLTGQRDEFQKRIASAAEVINRWEHLDLSVIADAIKKIPADKMGSKKLAEINKLSQDYYMKRGAIDNKKLIVENLELFQKQIDFFSKLI